MSSLEDRYLKLLREVLIDATYEPRAAPIAGHAATAHNVEHGMYWPLHGVTMIGRLRMNNLWSCVRQIIQDGVPGDLVETGVWRGGACIFMKALLETLSKDSHRKVFVCDSFQGLPQEDLVAFPKEKRCQLYREKYLAVSQHEVMENFKKHDLLDDKVVFVKGFFKDSLPGPIKDPIAILRLDGDLYESTIQALDALYHLVSPKGFVIVDDYKIPALGCQSAIHDFREKHGITSPLIGIDDLSVYWQKD